MHKPDKARGLGGGERGTGNGGRGVGSGERTASDGIARAIEEQRSSTRAARRSGHLMSLSLSGATWSTGRWGTTDEGDDR